MVIGDIADFINTDYQPVVDRSENQDPEDWFEYLRTLDGCYFEFSVDRILIPNRSCRFSDPQNNEYPHIGRKTRYIPDAKPLPFCTDDWWLLLGGRYLFVTQETIHLPLSMATILMGRRSLHTLGASFDTSAVSQGYDGKLVIPATVHDDYFFKIQQGTLFLAGIFFEVGNWNKVKRYQGIWGANKITTDGVERGR